MSVELFGNDTLAEFLAQAVEKMAANDSAAVSFKAEFDGKTIQFRLEVVNITESSERFGAGVGITE